MEKLPSSAPPGAFMTFARQLYALMWKNSLIKRRAWLTTLFEILLPVLVLFILWAIRAAVSKSDYSPMNHVATSCVWSNCQLAPTPTVANPKPAAQWFGSSNKLGSFKFAFIPVTDGVYQSRNPQTANDITMLGLIDSFNAAVVAATGVNMETSNRILTFQSDAALETFLTATGYGVAGQVADPSLVAAAIEINSFGSASLPKWSYTIRMNATQNSDTQAVPDPSQTKSVNTLHATFDAKYPYMYYGLGELFLQNVVENFIIQQTTNRSTTQRLFYSSAFPTPAYVQDDFIDIVSSILGFFFTLVYIWPVTRLVKALVEEKETRIKEGMKMMGLGEGVLWLSWLLTYGLIFLVTALLNMAVVSGGVFEHSEKGRIFIYFWFFSLAVTSYCYLISIFFSRAAVASTIGAVVFLVSFFPYYAVSDTTTASNGQKMLASLSPPIAFALGSVVIANLESAQTGVTASNSNVSINDYSYNNCITMFVVDFVLYTLLSVYLSRVIPSQWGTPLPWYYPFLPSFWCPPKPTPDSGRAQSSVIDGVQHVELREKSHVEGDHIESVSAEIRRFIGVKIRNLRKVFQVEGADEPQVAVRDLSLDLYKGQILALLGHNGAGKTTTINMLSGMLEATSGDADVFGLSMRTEMSAIRNILGVCPQHNILFAELTVAEHLRLFCMIKGIPFSEIDKHVSAMIDQVGLTEKINTFSSQLSGGMQRKLSVGIALIGGSKIVFLDEPTSGMDPYSRRATWDLLKKAKDEVDENGHPLRVMILTTHFMDEADQLGDRIAIMAKGEVKCCGSSLFLKARYGVGYTMTITKRDTFDEIEVPKLVTSNVVGSEVLSNIAGEIAFRLPIRGSSKFADLFDQFDAQQDRLGIDAYGISITTLEEVFLRVGHDEEIGHLQRQQSKLEIQAKSANSRLRRISRSKINEVVPDRPSSSSTATGSEIVTTQQVVVRSNSTADSTSSSSSPIATLTGSSKDEARDEKDPATLQPLAGSTSPHVETDAAMDVLGALKTNENPYDMFVRHFRALLVKRLHNARRDRKVWTWTILYPIILLFCVGLLLLVNNTRANVAINISQFNQPSPTPFVISPLGNPALFPPGQNSPSASILKTQQDIDLFSLTSATLNSYTTGAADAAALASALTTSQSTPVKLDPTTNATVLQPALQMSNYLLNSLATLTDSNDITAQSFPGLQLSRYIGFYTIDDTWYATNTTPSSPLTDGVILFYNTSAIYGLPIALNLYNQYMLQNLTGSGAALIDANIHAFPNTAQQKTLINSIASIFICVAFAFIPASFVGYAVKEEEVKVKHQQFISGVGVFAYYVSSYVWDFFNYIFPGLFCMVVMALYGIDSVTGTNSGATILGIILYGLSVIPFSYMLSFLFSNSTSAQNITLIFFILTGALLNIASSALSIISSTQSANKVLKFFWRLFPPFCLGEVFGNLMTRSTTLIWGTPRGLWDLDITGYPMIYMTLETFIYFGAVLLIEKIRSTPEILTKFQHDNTPYRTFTDEDADVAKERERLKDAPVPDMVHNKEVISIRGLRKVYGQIGANTKIAVHDLWLGIQQGVCYGYLGINGAGKTTTLKMLTADIIPTQGTAYLNGLDIRTEQTNIRRLLGYCPQFDSLIDRLTAREHLTLFARIKGVEEAKIAKYVELLINRIGLQEGIADKPTMGYSGGNKRKLCVGIALIGNPPIVFLDEPSTGMDPASRRFMWDLIASTMSGRSVILTTHSMEECEALCQQIGVMVGGRLRCSGSSQHLKSVYGYGYQVDAHIKGGPDQLRDFSRFLEQNFAGAKVIEEHGENVKYRIPKDNMGTKVTIAQMFRLLEANRDQLHVSEYSVSETTLEQIFIHFAKQQEEETGQVAGFQN